MAVYISARELETGVFIFYYVHYWSNKNICKKNCNGLQKVCWTNNHIDNEKKIKTKDTVSRRLRPTVVLYYIKVSIY